MLFTPLEQFEVVILEFFKSKYFSFILTNVGLYIILIFFLIFLIFFFF